MKILLSFLLVTLVSAVLSQGPAVDNTTTSTTPETTTAESTTPETTTAESTTPETTTAASTTPETTTAASTTPETTTKASTSTSSTTELPVTTPSPDLQTCSWNVTRENVTCILAELKAQFIIPNASHINLSCNASTVGSDCSSNETQILVLSERNYYSLTMVFEKDSSKKKAFVTNVTFAYTLPNGEKGSGSDVLDNLFNVKVGNSYLCKSEIKVHLENITMDIQTIQIQAFGEKNSQEFGSAEECEADDKISDVVPIAVGVALAALIIIVLIAYLVGRRRSRQRGYQSV